LNFQNESIIRLRGFSIDEKTIFQISGKPDQGCDLGFVVISRMLLWEFFHTPSEIALLIWLPGFCVFFLHN